jgi:hypothetical protein
MNARRQSKRERDPGTTLAYAYRSGQIGFIDGPGSMPDGALFLGSGPQQIIRDLISGISRHAYDGVTLLVPGVPESESDEAAYTAFMRFFERIQDQLAVTP